MNPIYKFELNRESVNLVDPSAIIAGRILDPGNGAFDVDSNYQTTETRISVTPGTTYAIKDNNNNAVVVPVVVFYEPDGSYSYGSTNVSQVTIPNDGIGYIRFSFPITVNARDISFAPSNQSYTPYLGPIAYPIYKDDLAKDFEKESGQEFFRAKLSGKLTFTAADYDWITAQAFDFQFLVTVFVSYDAGRTWTEYWRGTFWKTDCEFDQDAKTVVVTPTVLDQYNDVLAGLDKEYNLIDLAPEIIPVKADKRPMVQVYVPGQSVIGCFLSGMWWEQDCEPVSDTEMMDIGGGAQGKKLEYYYHFAINKGYTNIRLSGSMTPQLPANVSGVATGQSGKYFDFYVDGIHYFRQTDTNLDVIGIYDPNTGAGWQNRMVSRDLAGKYSVTVYPFEGTPATGNITLDIETIDVYSRFVCDTETINSVSTYPIPSDDLVENNRNYTRIVGYYFPNTISFSNRHTETPTKWGLYQPGEYYLEPYSIYQPEYFPVARNGWGYVSVWFSFDAFDWIVERSGRKEFTIRYAYPIFSVISVLLGKIAPGITHDGTTAYSQFLYGTNIIGIDQTLLITPKSNIVNAGYDQPAQTAPITLRSVLDMLRDCFRCYWFIDSNGKFRVEHIQYFRNGGSYSGSPVVGIDLTEQEVTRSGKKWAFARNQFKFDKPEMVARYQFGWMDDVTQLFEGFPIDIISKYVNPDNIEQINVSKFTSDIDYILLNPGEISKDGFVLLAGIAKNLLSETKTIVTTQSGSTGYGLIMPFTRDQGAKIRIRIKVDSGDAVVRFATAGGAGISSGPRFYSTEGVVTQTLNVPENAGRLTVSTSVIGATVTVYEVSSGLELPYVNYVVNSQDHYLQNAYVAFCILQRYYAFDMPAPRYSINGVEMFAQGIKRLKTQTIRFPALTDPDLVQLVKTNLGNGTIEKLSVNLSSRNANATLKYDTE